MSEQHHIVGLARGEPLPAGRVGVCVRFPLSGCPSSRWSRDMTARLTRELTGHAAVGYLKLNDIVQGNEIVLEGVESGEAPTLAGAVERAVDATNDAGSHFEPADDDAEQSSARRAGADDIASNVRASQRQPSADDRP
jgi:hypothetical protein